jgi:serine kinase of HPr protein (carbohydrate metabolism regulator)
LLTEPMEPKMLTVLDHYLSHASTTALVVHGSLVVVGLFGILFGAGNLVDHVAAVRAAR